MNLVLLRSTVDALEANHSDDEAAHATEDALMREWIRANAGPEELAEFHRLWSLGFARWCA